ncbi:T9SS type A sorting domain-containing protein [Chryseobacterium sp. OV279]|uniref:T9SS type A sorting domain-containing protein n=1 Tax=Chryseobacterium sp. OV279 TaxID=1500285 RepID=UPI003977A999
MYPNPSKGIFIIEADAKKSITYSVFAIDGKLVSPKIDVTNRKNIRTSGEIRLHIKKD